MPFDGALPIGEIAALSHRNAVHDSRVADRWERPNLPKDVARENCVLIPVELVSWQRDGHVAGEQFATSSRLRRQTRREWSFTVWRTVRVQAFQLWPTSNEMTRIPVKLNEALLKSPP